MANKNSTPQRISPKLFEKMKEMREKNDLTMRQVSDEIAMMIDEIKTTKKKIIREIKF